MNPFPDYQVPEAVQHQFQPYEDNGGSIIAIGGDNFAVIGADTRLSAANEILTRSHSKLRTLTSKVVLGTGGSSCDCEALAGILETRVRQYADAHEDREISLNAASQMMSTIMYERRFFPYNVKNILAGLYEGKGYVYSFDAIGHLQRHAYCAAGASEAMLQPILDNQIGMTNMEEPPNVPLTLDRAVNLIMDAFVSAAERNIHTGDSVLISIITENGIEEGRVALRKD